LPAGEPPQDAAEVTARLAACVREAGALALGKFRSSFKSWTKGVSSPVSEVDIAVDEMLRERLCRIDPRYGWLSEESIDDATRCDAARVWIVDPIDGTRAFIAGLTDWAVSAALVERGRPIAAALFAPAENALYLATAGGGATLNGQPLRAADSDGLAGTRITGPKRRVDAVAQFAPDTVALPRVNSLALRIAHIADGSIDVAFAGGNSHDWDLAAADLIVQESGALLSDFAGRLVTYNRPDPVHAALLAAGRSRHAALVELIAREASAFA
jgi:myo-inositol-1(or 4)-monophosphatase